MPLSKSRGNMYSWADFTNTHLGGECRHRCSYCYVHAMARRFKSERYQGPLKLIESELKVNYGSGRTIFVEHCHDLFAEDVPHNWIDSILEHCCQYPDNDYVFQTKDPGRMRHWLGKMPPRRLLGCTIETENEGIVRKVSRAPTPLTRVSGMGLLSGERLFVTVEPILRGDMLILSALIATIGPEFVNIGADSKGTGLDEPTAGEVRQLIRSLRARRIPVIQKGNLARLLKLDT